MPLLHALNAPSLHYNNSASSETVPSHPAPLVYCVTLANSIDQFYQFYQFHLHQSPPSFCSAPYGHPSHTPLALFGKRCSIIFELYINPRQPFFSLSPLYLSISSPRSISSSFLNFNFLPRLALLDTINIDNSAIDIVSQLAQLCLRGNVSLRVFLSPAFPPLCSLSIDPTSKLSTPGRAQTGNYFSLSFSIPRVNCAPRSPSLPPWSRSFFPREPVRQHPAGLVDTVSTTSPNSRDDFFFFSHSSATPLPPFTLHRIISACLCIGFRNFLAPPPLSDSGDTANDAGVALRGRSEEEKTNIRFTGLPSQPNEPRVE